MIYTLKHLRTDSLETLKSECAKVDLLTEDGEIITASHNHHLHVIGTLYAPTGTMLTGEYGNEYEEKAAIEGFHANLKYKKDVGLNHLAIEVLTPYVK